MQKTKLRMWGNSYAVRLPKALIETIGLKDGSEFQILYKDKQIILKEKRQESPHQNTGMNRAML